MGCLTTGHVLTRPDPGPAATHIHVLSQPRSRSAIPPHKKVTYPAPARAWASGVSGGRMGCGGAAWGVEGHTGRADETVVAPTAICAAGGWVGQTYLISARISATRRRRWLRPSRRDGSTHLCTRAPAAGPSSSSPFSTNLCSCPLSARRVTQYPRLILSASSCFLFWRSLHCVSLCVSSLPPALVLRPPLGARPPHFWACLVHAPARFFHPARVRPLFALSISALFVIFKLSCFDSTASGVGLAFFAVVGAMSVAFAYRGAALCRGAAASTVAVMSCEAPNAYGAPPQDNDPVAMSSSVVDRHSYCQTTRQSKMVFPESSSRGTSGTYACSSWRIVGAAQDLV